MCTLRHRTGFHGFQTRFTAVVFQGCYVSSTRTAGNAFFLSLTAPELVENRWESADITGSGSKTPNMTGLDLYQVTTAKLFVGYVVKRSNWEQWGRLLWSPTCEVKSILLASKAASVKNQLHTIVEGNRQFLQQIHPP